MRRIALTCLFCLSVVPLVRLDAGAAAAGGGHWAFQRGARPDIPVKTQQREWIRNAVDAFILSRLEQEGLIPSAEADRITLLRRVTLDLTGLPPTLRDVEQFLADDRPDAYERLVDRLLASPHYGERWARVWLDLCHYGDSDGHLTDQLRPVAWRYRDWVTQALNENMPFDRFTLCQLAGDLLEYETLPPQAAIGRAQRRHLSIHGDDPIMGTGFLRQTLSNREGGADLDEYRVEQVVDRTSLVGTIWLGLTVACARCHDHKYDPLTQAEFYELYACLDQADEVNIDAPLPAQREAYLQARPEYEQARQAAIAPYRDGLSELQRAWEARCLQAAQHPGQDHVWDRQWELLGLIWGGGLGEGQLEGTEIVKLSWNDRTARQQDDLLDYFLAHGSIVDPQRYSELKLDVLRKELDSLRGKYPLAFATRAPVMQAAMTARQTFVHERGDFRSPGEQVQPGYPAWLPADDAPSTVVSHGGGDPTALPARLALAQWIVHPDNPLTARVAVNRMWQEFFGRGLVLTSEDFGTRGDPPTHPLLLDWLADEFVRSGWDVKHMHRLLVVSATYRQSSRPRPDVQMRDPENTLLARQSSLRVPAETVRDMGLAASGLLSRRLGGPAVFPPQDERVTMEAFGSNAWPQSTGGDRYRRGLYTFVLRTSPFAQAIIFDAPSPQLMCTRRERSNTPLQALTLLNDPMFYEMAEALAERVRRDTESTDRQRIDLVWRLCLARPPSDDESRRLMSYLLQQRQSLAAESQAKDQQPAEGLEQRAWTRLASVVLNLHEFITRD
jgi:hypothetical protein